MRRQNSCGSNGVTLLMQGKGHLILNFSGLVSEQQTFPPDTHLVTTTPMHMLRNKIKPVKAVNLLNQHF